MISISTYSASSLIEFAQTAENIAATSKRTTKALLLGDYFNKLGDEDLTIAARFFAGYIFPLRDQRIINIGGAALLKAITTIANIEKSTFQECLVNWRINATELITLTKAWSVSLNLADVETLHVTSLQGFDI